MSDAPSRCCEGVGACRFSRGRYACHASCLCTRPERARGVNAAIAVVRARQLHYEQHRDGDQMRTHPATFAVLDELLVLLDALMERS